MGTTSEQFWNRLVESGLWTRDDVDTARSTIDGDAEAVARELINRRRLTSFQAQQLLGATSGVVVLGNYVLLDKIGAGGMGQVFKAEHRKMRRVVALKILPENVTSDPGAVQRFHREIQAVARLSH